MSRTIEVFEHGRLALAPTGPLQSWEFDELVRFNDRHGGKYFDVGHRHIKLKQFVGYLEVGHLAIEILPKADQGAPVPARAWRRGLLDMLRVALGLRIDQLPDASQTVGRNGLLDLIARAYLVELRTLLRQGLAKGYRTTRSNGAVFRGRLQMAAHLRENIARADRFFVEYQIFDHDILVNHALGAALEVLSWCALSPSVSTEIEACLAEFSELHRVTVTAAMLDRIHLGRGTRRYEQALLYARMILDQRGPQLQAGSRRVFALLFDMNKLWERYVATLLRRVAPAAIQISTQEQCQFWHPKGHERRRLRPDLVLRLHNEPLLVIDTKWKVPSNGVPSDDDLKQMFVYNELLGTTRSVLLYPRTSGSTTVSGSFATKLHGCEQAHVGLLENETWNSGSIQKQLGALLDAFLPEDGSREPH